MSKSWYILHVFTGYEQKIDREIHRLMDVGEINTEFVTAVKVPTEEIVEIRNNKKHVTKNLILPGYVMVEMDLPQLGWKETCNSLRKIQGVTGFVGTKPAERPRPISAEEAKRILMTAGEIKGEKSTRIKQSFEVGEQVKISAGPFADITGAIEEVYAEKNKLKVNVQIFGRATPVEVDVTEVEKI